MLKRALGDLWFWQTARPLSPKEWLRVLLIALIPATFTLRRLLSSDYQFVGNDADLPGLWLWRFRFTRLWMAVGVDPSWDPYFQLGSPNSQGPTHPFSLLNLLQQLFTSTEKGLDYSLFFLSILLALSSVAMLIRLRFSPLASLLGGLLLGGSGTVITQLFAGHLAIYSCFCLTPGLVLTLLEGTRRCRILALFPAALMVTLLFLCGEFQGPYIVLWASSVFMILRAALGSPEAIPAPTLWTETPGASRDGHLLGTTDPRTRLQEVAWTLLKLSLVYLLGGLLSTIVWFPTIASGVMAASGDEIFVHSAPPLAWLTLFIPHLFLGAGQDYNWTGWAQWEGQPGMGPGIFLVILIGLGTRQRRDLWLPGGLLALATLLAVGKYTPIFAWYAHLDPWIGSFEVPSRLYFVVNFASALLFAWGVDALIQSQWQLSPAVFKVLQRMVGVMAGLWLVSYFLDGQFELWQLFLHHAQFDFSYSGLTPVNPQEFYALTWTRFSAACALVGLLAYGLIRLPQPRRIGLVSLLILLDVTRFSYPYINMRANQEFQVPSEVFNIIQEKKLYGKVLNTFQSSAVGIFGLLRVGEWSSRGVVLNPDVGLLLQSALRIFKGDYGEHPCLFNRFLGVHLYFQPKEWLDDPNIKPFYEKDTGYSTADAKWSLIVDDSARPPVYVSRKKQAVGTPYRLLQELQKNPNKLTENWTFLDPKTFNNIDHLIRAKQWTRTALDDKVGIIQEYPTSIDIACELSTPGLVILNQAWSPDWTVLVDGLDAPCLPCQLGYNRGVLVDAGVHRILFSYSPELPAQARHRSWAVLVCSILFILFCWGVTFIKNRLAR